MNTSKLSSIVKTVRTAVSRHSPEILTGIGIAGMITTTVLAVKATPKALKKIDEYEESCCLDHQKLPPVEVVKLTWKYYVPAAVTGGVSIACLIGASSVNARRNAALATAYKLSETALTEYREKVIETIGEKKEQAVRDQVAKEQLDKNPVSKSEVIITGTGDSLCFDPMSSRYFMSNIELIRRAENKINKQILHDITGYASLNDFYDEIGLSRTDIGDYVGWNAANLMDLDIGAQKSEDGRPALVINHYNRPDYNYDR